MNISGSHTVRAPRNQVWEALQDPEVLVRTIPGCTQLEEIGDGVYRTTVRAGIASITGTYTGEVALTDAHAPESYTLKAKGQGGPGTIDASARIRLLEDGAGSTKVEYDAEAVVGGSIAGVGQRVLTGVAKRNATEFFSAVDRHVSGEPIEGVAGVPEAEASRAATVGAEVPSAEAPDAARAASAEPQRRVFRAPEPPPAQHPDPRLLLAAGVIGALLALLGVLVGRRTRT